MANRFWKKLEKSPGYQRGKLLLKRLTGRELWLKPELGLRTRRIGGWWLCPEALDATSIVYSLGVGDDLNLDQALIDEFGLLIHAFDPTPSTIEWLARTAPPGAPNFNFHPWAIAARDGTLTLYPRVKKGGQNSGIMYTLVQEERSIGAGIEVPTFTIKSVMSRLGHLRIDLLKVDIEGAEYEVLEDMLNSTIRPTQLLVEFHHRFPGIRLASTAELIGKLRAAGYRIFAISETGREISFLLEAWLESSSVNQCAR